MRSQLIQEDSKQIFSLNSSLLRKHWLR